MLVDVNCNKCKRKFKKDDGPISIEELFRLMVYKDICSECEEGDK